jgi:hypothetical protein
MHCRVEREKRAAEQEARARDVRLQRALDEVEKYKAMLSELRTQVSEGWAPRSEPQNGLQ